MLLFVRYDGARRSVYGCPPGLAHRGIMHPMLGSAPLRFADDRRARRRGRGLQRGPRAPAVIGAVPLAGRFRARRPPLRPMVTRQRLRLQLLFSGEIGIPIPISRARGQNVLASAVAAAPVDPPPGSPSLNPVQRCIYCVKPATTLVSDSYRGPTPCCERCVALRAIAIAPHES